MSGSVAVETGTGAQLLPEVLQEEWQQMGAWSAYVACDADLRAKYPEWLDVAGRITITYSSATVAQRRGA